MRADLAGTRWRGARPRDRASLARGSIRVAGGPPRRAARSLQLWRCGYVVEQVLSIGHMRAQTLGDGIGCAVDETAVCVKDRSGKRVLLGFMGGD